MDITVGLKCNNKCIFCPRKDYLKVIACQSAGEIYKDIECTRKESDSIIISGGEVTILKEIWDIVDFCRKKKFKEVGIITNGRKLKDRSFARRLVYAGVKDFAISIYSLNREIHDRITQVRGSCSETRMGIENVLNLSSQYNISLRINLVLNYWNHKDICLTLKKLFSLGIKNFTVAEQIIVNKKANHLSFEKIKESFKKIIEIDLKSTRLCLRGFPPCLLEGSIFSINDDIVLRKKDSFIILERQNVDTLVKGGEKKQRYIQKFQELFTRTNKCKTCLFIHRCLGIQKAYL